MVGNAFCISKILIFVASIKIPPVEHYNDDDKQSISMENSQRLSEPLILSTCRTLTHALIEIKNEVFAVLSSKSRHVAFRNNFLLIIASDVRCFLENLSFVLRVAWKVVSSPPPRKSEQKIVCESIDTVFARAPRLF